MNLLEQARKERDRINRVIALLEDEEGEARKPRVGKKSHRWTNAERKAMSAKLKAAWAKRKRA